MNISQAKAEVNRHFGKRTFISANHRPVFSISEGFFYYWIITWRVGGSLWFIASPDMEWCVTRIKTTIDEIGGSKDTGLPEIVHYRDAES